MNLHILFRSVASYGRRAFLDLVVLTGSLLAFLWVAYQFALFSEWVGPDLDPVKRIDFYEALAGAALLFLGIWIFAMRRASELRVEAGRRSEAEIRADDAEFRAQHDPLTGLGNRTKFDRCLAAMAERQGSAGGEAALFLMDLNGFKTVNDQFGHLFGDEVLRITAQRLISVLRAKDDQVCRLGGDEFAIVANLGTLPDPSGVVEKMSQKVIRAVDRPIHLEGRIGTVGVAIGIARLSPGLSPTALIASADQALYMAKERSRAAGGSYYVTSPVQVAGHR